MSLYLQFVVLGLSAGAVYAALANGLISIYRATGILNFGLGATALWGAYVYAGIRASGEMTLPVGSVHVGELAALPALAIALVTAVVLSLLAHLLIFRPLRSAPTLAQVIASVGLMLTMQAIVVLRFGAGTYPVDDILPSRSVSLLGASLPVTSLYLAGIAIVLALISWAYFRFTRLGLATRAGSADERALRLMGYSPDRLAAIVWAGTGAMATLVVTLAAPSIGLNPTGFAVAIVPALAVALIGRLSSIGIACAAGLGLGAFQGLIQLMATKPWWPGWAATGLEDAVPFLVIVVALFVFGGKIPSRGSLGELALPKVTVPRLEPLPVATVIVLTSLLLVVASGSYRFGLLTSIIMSLLALSWVVVTGYLGQISLAQLAIAGVSGILLSKLTTAWGFPFPLSMLASSTVAMALGVLVGLPALRIRGAQLAVVTLALAVALESFVLNNSALTPLTGLKIADPSFLGLDLAVRSGTDLTRLEFCLMVLAVVVVVTLLIAKVLRGSTGHAFLAVRSNERAAASVGIDVARMKLIGFALAAFTAGMAGALMGYSRGQLSAASFTAIGGLAVLAIVYLGGIGSLSGAIIAGLLAPLGVGFVFNSETLHLGEYYPLFAGLSLIVTAIFNPVGIAGAIRSGVDRVRSRFGRSGAPPGVPRSAAGPSVRGEELAHVD